MTARFAPEELDGLLDLLFYTSKTADGDDAEFYRTIADKLDAMVHENGLLCEHENLKHKTGIPADQIEVADLCPDCLVDYDCECDTE